MVKDLLTPDYIFESSWEVCNKLGGIYTVLSTRANTLQEKFRDRIFFIGPDVWQGKENSLFIESDNLCAAWKKHALEKDELSVRIGRWNIPGEPIVILVDFQPFFEKKDDIYTEMWNRYQVDSLHAYGDYDEASMFSYAAGRVVESFYRYNLTETDKVVYQAHEWMTGMGALYVQEAVPEVATIFTTHATSIGRSIAGNHKPLYDYLFAYNGDQMAQELNMQSKHSIEKQTAHYVDCFTTVSEITNNECKELLDKPADVVLMNGFEDDFVKFYNEHIGTSCDGAGVGLKFEDEYGALTLCNGIVKTEDGIISCTIDIRVPVTLKAADVRTMCEARLEDENGRIEIGEIGDPLFFPRESPLVNALYKAYVDVTGDTEHEPMVIGGGTYAKSLKNIIAFGPEKLGMDYHIHSADEFILVSEMEEAVLIYMEAIKNLLAI